jgi:hypothetical protein
MSDSKKLLLAYGVCSLACLFPEVAHAAVALGDMFTNIGTNMKQAGPAIKYGSFAVGGVMSATGVKGIYDSQRAGGGQVPLKDGIIKLAVGVGLLSLGGVIQSGSVTLFGSDQASGVGELGL